MNYREWEQAVPAEIKGDSVWKSEAYRQALFLADLAWHDATKLVRDRRTISLADQLFRAAGGVSADIEEGYSRGTGRDRARFYEYALGSGREARGWYYKGRHIVGEQVSQHRLGLLTHILKLLLTMIPDRRGQTLHDDITAYKPQTRTNQQQQPQRARSSIKSPCPNHAFMFHVSRITFHAP